MLTSVIEMPKRAWAVWFSQLINFELGSRPDTKRKVLTALLTFSHTFSETPRGFWSEIMQPKQQLGFFLKKKLTACNNPYSGVFNMDNCILQHVISEKSQCVTK